MCMCASVMCVCDRCCADGLIKRMDDMLTDGGLREAREVREFSERGRRIEIERGGRLEPDKRRGRSDH